MSQLDSANPSPVASQPGAAPTVQKQRINVYTMMLIMSLIAISIGCTLLYFELERFGSYPWWNVSEAKAASGTSFNTTIPQMHEQIFGAVELSDGSPISLKSPFRLM